MSPRRIFACLAVSLAAVTGIVAPVPTLAEPVADQSAADVGGYIVTVRSRDDIDAVIRVARQLGARRFQVFRYALGGFATDLTPQQADRLSRDPRVRRVSPNLPVRKRVVAEGTLPSLVQAGAPYQLDRVDQASLPLDGNFTSPNEAEGVAIYMIDTGVRASHIELAGRVVAGIDVVGVDSIGRPAAASWDCDGHGTHTAALAAGTNFGVAKRATVIAVRVLNCDGDGDIEGVIKGIDWVIRHHRAGTLAVANLSLGVAADKDSDPLDDAVRDLVADGIVPVVAAGNSDEDACGTSPGHVAEVLNVGATGITDDRFHYSGGGSNYGSCLDLFAPGVRILSASADSDTDTHYESGTSMASPLVAGYAAMIAKDHPGACPASVVAAVVARGVRDVVKNPGANSPNVMLNVANVSGVAPAEPGTPSALVATPTAGGITVSWDPGCNGGFDSDTTNVRVYRADGSSPIRSLTVKSTDRVTVSGLDASQSYRVSVRRKTAGGASAWSEKSIAMSPTPITAGAQPRTAALAVSTEAKVAGQWSIDTQSASVCRTLNGNARLYVLRRGKCVVDVTPRYTDVAFQRTFSFVEAPTPANSGSGARLIYDRSSKRLYSVDAGNRVKRSIAVVAPVAPPATGKYAVRSEQGSSEFTARRGNTELRFAALAFVCVAGEVCDNVFSPDELGTAVAPSGVYLPAGDARWFAGQADGMSTLVVIR